MMVTKLHHVGFGLVLLVLGAGLLTQFANAETSADGEMPRLVSASGNAVMLPEGLIPKLGIQTTEAKPRAATKPRILQLPGSTAFDPAKIVRIRGQFTPFKVIEIGKIKGPMDDRELRPGDKVAKGQMLAVVQSDEVAVKKHDLFDAAVQLKLDAMILDQIDKAAGAVPETFALNAKRNVLADLSAVTRAKNVLKKWGLSASEIEAVGKEARELAAKPKPDSEDERNARLKEWAKVAMVASEDGIIIERNASVGEVVVDARTNVFQIADVDRLVVLANIQDVELPNLNALTAAQRRWSVRTTTGAEVESPIEEIGVLIDPSTQTAIIKGSIENKDHLIRAGQSVTASITLPPVVDEVSLSATAVVEEKGQNFVFVQPDMKKPIYEQRRVMVVRRGHDAVHILARLTPEQERQGYQPIQPGDRVVSAGALELKAIVADLKTP